MARIADEVIERIKAEVSLERLVQAYGVELKKQGKDRVGRVVAGFSVDVKGSFIGWYLCVSRCLLGICCCPVAAENIGSNRADRWPQLSPGSARVDSDRQRRSE